MATLSIADQLHSSRTLIENSLQNDDILNEVSLLGYDEKKLTEGKAIYQSALQLDQDHKKEYGEQVGATDHLNKCLEEANKTYSRTIKLARIAFEGDQTAQVSLELTGSRHKSIAKWIQQSSSFYGNLTKNRVLTEKLGTFGYTVDKLNAEMGLVTKVKEASQHQLSEMGQAQNATKVRDSALDDLDHWVSTYRKVARIALEDSPQLLEKLGIIIKS